MSRTETGRARIALVTQDLSRGGGAAVLTSFLYRVIEECGWLVPSIVSLATAASDTESVRLAAPSTWRRGVGVREGSWRGLPYVHVGAVGAEIEALRYRARPVLSRLLRGYDVVQVVAGTPAWANAALACGRPVVLYTATTVRKERATRFAQERGWRRQWLRAMTEANARVEARVLARVDHVFALSEYTARNLAGAVPAARLEVGVPGVDTDFFHPTGPREGGGHILAVGRFADARKNLRLLLDAYVRLVRRDAGAPDLVLVGERPAREDQAYLERMGIGERVRVRGDVSPSSLAAHFRAASLFVLSSNEEGLGLVILEAMASGVPVVSTRCGGPDSLVTDGVTGFLTPVGDAAALADAMERVIGDEALRVRMGRAGRQVAQERFSLEATGRPFLRRYEELLGVAARPAGAGSNLQQGA